MTDQTEPVVSAGRDTRVVLLLELLSVLRSLYSIGRAVVRARTRKRALPTVNALFDWAEHTYATAELASGHTGVSCALEPPSLGCRRLEATGGHPSSVM